MGQINRIRIAERHTTVTTPIEWEVARRGRNGPKGKVQRVEAAIIEVSIMGAAIVCPGEWEAPVGTAVMAHWHTFSGRVVVRRAQPFLGNEKFWLYGVEYGDNPSELGRAVYEELVLAPAGAMTTSDLRA